MFACIGFSLPADDFRPYQKHEDHPGERQRLQPIAEKLSVDMNIQCKLADQEDAEDDSVGDSR